MSEDQPTGELALKTVAMPADTNPAGDIFGGWIMSLMDLSAGTAASERAKGRTATASVSHLNFLRPVKVGDVVCVYTKVIRVGRTSISLAVEAWAVQRGRVDQHKVTSAEFVMVALDGHGKPRPVDKDD
jgi:acyl-CoA thioesterase YciA